MKPDQDNADPEVGPASTDTPRTSTVNSNINEETSIIISKPDAPPPAKSAAVKTSSTKNKKDEFIPLTHPPPPPHQQSSSSQTPSSDEKQPTTTATGQNQTAANKTPNIRLIHPILLKVPMQIRYTVYGALSSALFMVMYNVAVDKLGYLYVPSSIYAATYLIFIPIQHAMAATMVFGWPDRYLPSLTSNVPIGLTAIALGSYLTAYLDRIDFDETVEAGLITMGLVQPTTVEDDNKQKEGSNEFYTSLFVLIVTSLWSFVLSVLVNAPAETPDKKEL